MGVGRREPVTAGLSAATTTPATLAEIGRLEPA